MRNRVLAVAMVSAAFMLGGAASPDYRVDRRIAGPDGGWDYARVDGETHRLYVARSTSVMEVDLAHGDAVRSFGDIAHGHAVVPITGGKLLLVTSGKDDSVRLFGTDDGHEVARIAVGNDPDAAIYDPASGQAAVMNAKDGTVSIIDVAARRVARVITLKPGLEYAALAADGTLFVNNEDESEIETANIATGTAGAAIKLTGCTGPSGLALDKRTGMLISACANRKAAVVDAHARKLVRLLDIGQGPDAVILDESRRTALIPCGRDGTLSVIALDAKGGPAVVGSAKTAAGARTGAVDPADGTIYLPSAEFGPAPAGGGRPQPLPGTFRVVAVKRS